MPYVGPNGGMAYMGANGGMVATGGAGGAMIAGGAGGGAVVVAGDGAGGAACCAGACTTTGAAAMTFVGGGRGAYTTETTYKYVGAGGEFAYVTPKRSLFGVVLGSSVALLVLIVVIIIILLPGTTTTTPPPLGPAGSCLMWGDPHVETFDHSFPNFFEQGEYWVVKAPMVWIQGRFLATPFTNGLAATHAIALGGPFMQGHTIIVGPMENGQILIDGQPQCTGFPSTCGVPGVATVSYNGEGKLVDSAQSHLVKHIVHIDAPLGVHLQVMRWANHINVEITMRPRAGGQDGACGNFNGNADDDSTEQIMARAGKVPPGECIFHHQTPPAPPPNTHCDEGKKASARALCIKERPEAKGPLLAACIFDVCIGGPQYAAQDGMSESEA